MQILLMALLVAASAKQQHDWLGADMPLPLAVHTPQDLAFKNVAERQYLIFNLLASGKVAWDQGDFPTAAQRWETLLSLPGLDPEIDKVVRPLAEEARPPGTRVEGSSSSGGTAGPGGADRPFHRGRGGLALVARLLRNWRWRD